MNQTDMTLQKTLQTRYYKHMLQLQSDTGLSIDDIQPLYFELDQLMSRLLPMIEGALMQRDYKEIQKYAHQIKGTASNLRVNSLSEAASGLEVAAKTEAIVEVATRFQMLKLAYE